MAHKERFGGDESKLRNFSYVVVSSLLLPLLFLASFASREGNGGRGEELEAERRDEEAERVHEEQKKRLNAFSSPLLVDVDTSQRKKKKKNEETRGQIDRERAHSKMPARVAVDRQSKSGVDVFHDGEQPLPSLQTGQLVGHEGAVLCVEFNATGAYALTGGKVILVSGFF